MGMLHLDQEGSHKSSSSRAKCPIRSLSSTLSRIFSGRHCPLADDKSYRPQLTTSSANQNECTIEQEDSIVFKMELTIEMRAVIIVYHTVCLAEFDWMPRNSRVPYYKGLENPTKSAKR